MKRNFLTLTILLVFTLSCQFMNMANTANGAIEMPTASQNVKSPTLPVTPPNNQPIAQATESANTPLPDEINITMTEEEATKKAQEFFEENPDQGVTNSAVRFQDNHIEFDGHIQIGLLNSNFYTVLNIVIDEKGAPHLQMESGKLGILPVPKALGDEMIKKADSLFIEKTSSTGKQVIIEKVEIGNGVLTVKGRSQ